MAVRHIIDRDECFRMRKRATTRRTGVLGSSCDEIAANRVQTENLRITSCLEHTLARRSHANVHTAFGEPAGKRDASHIFPRPGSGSVTAANRRDGRNVSSRIPAPPGT
jgi:hypothetical protein